MAKCQYKPSQEILDNLGQEDYSCELEAHEGHDRCLLHLNKLEKEHLKASCDEYVDLFVQYLHFSLSSALGQVRGLSGISVPDTKQLEKLYFSGSNKSRISPSSEEARLNNFIETKFELFLPGMDFYGFGEKGLGKVFLYASKPKSTTFLDCSIFGDLKGISRSFSFHDCDFEDSTFFISQEGEIFFGCGFYGDTEINLNLENKNSFLGLFSDCDFHGHLLLHGSCKGGRLGFVDKGKFDTTLPYGVSFSSFSFGAGINPARFLNLTFFSEGFFGPVGFIDCSFDCRFLMGESYPLSCEEDGVIDTLKLPEISFKDSEMNGKFEIKGKSISRLIFDNTKFNAVADLNGSYIDYLDMCRVDFLAFAAFENIEVKSKVAFDYVTFHSHATFRGAEFFDGINLDRANFSSEANFLDVDVDACIEGESGKLKSTRETYRLIKHSFDKIGNHLEANKFFAKEMDKYREELDEGRTRFSDIFSSGPFPRTTDNPVSAVFWFLLFITTVLAVIYPWWLTLTGMMLSFIGALLTHTEGALNRRIDHYWKGVKRWRSGLNMRVPVYWFNKIFSDFGQSYLLSIGWLLLAMVFYFYAFVFHRHMGWLHTESSCEVFASGYDKLNCLASGMIPFKEFLTNGMELLSLVFYIIFAVLVWQTVVALKRYTRR